jgi:hypothetical protein
LIKIEVVELNNVEGASIVGIKEVLVACACVNGLHTWTDRSFATNWPPWPHAEVKPIHQTERGMRKGLSIHTVVGPALFSLAVYLGWTFGRSFFCSVPI